MGTPQKNMLPTFFSRMVMFRILCCVICYYSVLVDGAVIQMNDGNVEENLIGKKATFMMFYGSKCEECVDIMPEWKRLANEWDGHPYGQIAQVDCETEGTEAICEYFQIQEIPTLVVGGSMEWDFYDGGHDYESLSEFAKKQISRPICTARVPENCLDEDLAILKPLQAKSTEQLLEMYDKAQAKIHALYKEFNKEEAKLLNARNALGEEINNAANEAAGEYDVKLVLQVMQQRVKEAALADMKAEDSL